MDFPYNKYFNGLYSCYLGTWTLTDSAIQVQRQTCWVVRLGDYSCFPYLVLITTKCRRQLLILRLESTCTMAQGSTSNLCWTRWALEKPIRVGDNDDSIPINAAVCREHWLCYSLRDVRPMELWDLSYRVRAGERKQSSLERCVIMSWRHCTYDSWLLTLLGCGKISHYLFLFLTTWIVGQENTL